MSGGTICSVATCRRKAMKAKETCVGEKLKFFRFPKDKKIRQEWIKKCTRKATWNADNRRICSKHFKSDDYQDELKARLMGYQPKLLKKNAIPSLYVLPEEEKKVTIVEMYDLQSPGIINIKDEPSIEIGETQVKSEIFDDSEDEFVNIELVEVKSEFFNDSDTESIIPVKSEDNGTTKCETENRNDISSTNSSLFKIKFEELESTKATVSGASSTISKQPNIPVITRISEQPTQPGQKLHTGDKHFKCIICDYACATSDILTQHLRDHSGEKAFKCPICEYAGTQRSFLTQHMRMHSEEKPFKCSVCDYACAQQSNLAKHMRTHTGDRPFKCTVCDYSFTQSGALNNHMRIHTGDKPFKCTVCDYSCKQSGNLNNHMRTHTGDKPFKCTICSYASAERSNLTQHIMRMHRGKDRFKCNICDYTSAYRSHLTQHIKRHTSPSSFP